MKSLPSLVSIALPMDHGAGGSHPRQAMTMQCVQLREALHPSAAHPSYYPVQRLPFILSQHVSDDGGLFYIVLQLPNVIAVSMHG